MPKRNGSSKPAETTSVTLLEPDKHAELMSKIAIEIYEVTQVVGLKYSRALMPVEWQKLVLSLSTIAFLVKIGRLDDLGRALHALCADFGTEPDSPP